MAHRHALIVEDKQQNLAILANLVAHEGFTHTDILDPRQVAPILDSLESLAIVFLDLEMPKLNGYDVFQQIKAIPRFKDVPVVAYTAHISEFNPAYQLGFHSFLAKPLDADRFPGQLARILSGERVWERV